MLTEEVLKSSNIFMEILENHTHVQCCILHISRKDLNGPQSLLLANIRALYKQEMKASRIVNCLQIESMPQLTRRVTW